jgi:DNA (cytosine-5)-methyltransferase 1
MSGNKFISLFCGCGGSSYGYTKSGFTGLLGIDSDKNVCKNYSLNFPNTKVWNEDLSNINPNDILSEFNLEKGELDLLDSSPPCQGFSVSGIRNLKDERNDLYLQTKRFIKVLHPKVFIIENVDGIIKGKYKGLFNYYLSELMKLDYKIKWKSMNSLYYGVPQKRQRVFIMGVRNDLGKEPIFPKHDSELVYMDEVINDVDFHSRGQFDKKLKKVTNNFSYTITKTPSMFFVSNGKKRKPRIDELKVLSTFPNSFKLEGSYLQKWGMIGNGVPPKLTERLGETVIKNIFN